MGTFRVNKNVTKTQVKANSDSLIKRNDLNKIKKRQKNNIRNKLIK